MEKTFSILDSDYMVRDLISQLGTPETIVLSDEDRELLMESFKSSYNSVLNESNLDSNVDSLVGDLTSDEISLDEISSAKERVHVKYDNIYNLAAQIMKGKGIKHFAFICGDPGVGKSFSVKQALKNEFYGGPLERKGYKPIWDKGNIGTSLTDITTYFYKNRSKRLIILDDCDKFLKIKDEAIQNTLKALLELDNTDANPSFITTPEGIRIKANKNLNELPQEEKEEILKNESIVSINKHLLMNENILQLSVNGKVVGEEVLEEQDKSRVFDVLEEGLFDDIDFSSLPTKKDDLVNMPSEWRFTSRIIFISNLTEKDINDAVQTRVTIYEIKLDREEFMARLYEILPGMLLDVDSEDSKEDIIFARNQAYAYLAAAVQISESGLRVAGVPVNINRQLEFRAIADLAGRWLLHYDLYCTRNNVVIKNDDDRNAVNNKIKVKFMVNEVIPYLARNTKAKNKAKNK